jgi:hypothetical protein
MRGREYGTDRIQKCAINVPDGAGNFPGFLMRATPYRTEQPERPS